MSLRLSCSGRPPLIASILAPNVVCRSERRKSWFFTTSADSVALQLDDDAHAFAVGLVPKVRDALDALLAHELGDLLDQHALVDLVGDRRDDQRLAILADLFDLDARPHDDRAAALVIRREDAAAPQDQAAGGEIRTEHDLAQLLDRHLGIVEVGGAGVDHLAEVVRRDVRRHADRDAAGAVDQQVRELGRQDRGFPQRTVVVFAEFDRVFVEVVEQRVGDLRQPALGVTIGGRRVTVDRAEVALAVDQRHAHREVLRQAHERVVDREVAVRVIFAHRLADDAGALHVFLVPVEPQLLHREQDAAVDRLQAVADVGQRAADDDAHRVLEIRALHLVRDRHGPDVGWLFAAGAAAVVVVVCHDLDFPRA